MLNIDYKKLLDIDYIKILNDILILSLLLYQIIPKAKVPNFILYLFKMKIVRVLLVGLLLIKGNNHPDTVIYVSIWYIIIIGQLGKQKFFENFANDLESDDNKKLNEERQKELNLLEKNLRLAKLGVKYSRINLNVSEKYADQVGYKNVKMGELMDDINDRLEKANESKDEPMIKLLEKIQKSVSRMEALSSEKNDTASNRVNDFKNTLSDSQNKLTEAKNEVKEFHKRKNNDDDDDEEEEEQITETVNYEKLNKDAQAKLEEARVYNKLQELALKYYHEDKVKLKIINKEIEDVSNKIRNNSSNPEMRRVLKIVKTKKKENREFIVKTLEESRKRYFDLKQKTEYILQLARLNFIDLKKYETKGRTAPIINKVKEQMINNYKKEVLNNLKTKKALGILKNYLNTLISKSEDYRRIEKKNNRKLDDANKTKKNKVLISTLEKIKDSIKETIEIIQKEINLQTEDLNKLKTQNSDEDKKIKMIYNEFQTKFKDKLESDISLIEQQDENSDDNKQDDTNQSKPDARIPTDA